MRTASLENFQQSATQEMEQLRKVRRHAQTCQGVGGSNFFSIFSQIIVNGKVFPDYMSAQTRPKSRKQVMSGDEAISDRKLDAIISKIDVLLQAKTEMLTKLSTLELTQATLVKDVNELKNSFKDTDLRILELNSDLASRAKQTEVDALAKKMDDLENRSKRNNIVIWGGKEESEKSFNSMIEFLETELFKNHMGLDDGIEIMRAHRTNVKKNADSENVYFITLVVFLNGKLCRLNETWVGKPHIFPIFTCV